MGVNYSGLKVPEAKGEIVEERSNRFTTGRILRRSRMAFYAKRRFCAAVAALNPFIGALKDKECHCDARRWQYTVTEEGRILGDRKQRIRDVRVGPDGYLYVLTDESDGKLLKVSPAATR